MYLKEETFAKFGYYIESLSISSSKPVILQCEYCQKHYESTPKRIRRANKILVKDCCGACKYEKNKEVLIVKHGVTNVFQLDSTKEKSKATNLENLGVEHAMQSKKSRDRSKATCLKKYGVENVFQSQQVREAYKKTCIEKYGVENVSSVEEFKKKRRETNLDKYGHEYYLGSDDCHQKMVDKFGVDNVFQLDEVIGKIRESHIKKCGTDHHLKVPEIAAAHVAKSRQTMIDSGIIQLHEGKTKVEWAEEVGFSYSHFSKLVNQYGWDYAVSSSPRTSNLERMIEDLLISEGVEYERQFYINNGQKYYADFKVGNIVIEACGEYWHSEYRQKDNSYHLKKREMYESEGLTPLFFWGNEIIKKFPIVKSIILNKLGRSTSLFARKLTIADLGSKTARRFFSENHLMGPGSGRTFALYDSSGTYAAMRVRQNRMGEWEISRFCTKSGYTVVGGFSRLLTHFIRECNPSSVTTFVDRRYGQGTYLSNFGFIQKSCYKSFSWTDGETTFHRMKYRSNCGYDIGLTKLWDCGQSRYTLTAFAGRIFS